MRGRFLAALAASGDRPVYLSGRKRKTGERGGASAWDRRTLDDLSSEHRYVVAGELLGMTIGPAQWNSKKGGVSRMTADDGLKI